MTWITAALLSGAILGMVNVIDSYFISRRMPSLQSFLLLPGIQFLIFGLAILIIHPLPAEIGTTPLMVAIASGMARALGVFLMLRAMRSEEVSRVIPVINTYPIFVAILAVPLLDETLGLEDWMAIFLTVAGAVLISTRWDSQHHGTHLRKSFTALMAASLLMGVANTTSKYALDYMSFWNMYSINAFCFCATFLLLSVRPSVLKDFWNINSRNLTLGLIALNECIALAGIILSFWAIERGPVSLVSTILSTRPAFVFLYAVALTRILPSILEERLSKGVIITKSISIALIIIGVTIINL